LEKLDLSPEGFAALRGVSRQYAMSTIEEFIKNPDEIRKLCQTLLEIGSDSARAKAERLKKIAAEDLGIAVSMGTAASFLTYTQIFAQNRELWIFADTPLDEEHTQYWETLCSEFLNKDDRMLVYFVPSLEIADQLAFRFENELLSRLYDAEGNRIKDARGFGATIFIIVTNLVAMMPYVIIANPGSANLRQEGMPSSGWVMGNNAYDLSELSSRFSNDLIQQVRTARMGLARTPENFFPIGGVLDEGSGIPIHNYRYLDRQLFEITHQNSFGLFDGHPIGSSGEAGFVRDEEEDEPLEFHPLKFRPIFIRAYRKKANDVTTRIKIPKGIGIEKRSSRYNHWPNIR